MSDLKTLSAMAHDVWAEGPRGRLFVRVWTPTGSTAASRSACPIVLFHDSLGCVDLWRDFPAELSAATGRRVIAYDRLGFGRSDPRDDTLAPTEFIADEAKTDFSVIRQQLGFEKFIAFGHSVGGGMAVNCAAQFAEACEALITESAQAFPEDRTLHAIAVAKEQFKDDTEVNRLKRYHGEKAKWVLDAWTESWLHPDFAYWSLVDILPRVTSPVLAIHGVHDEYGTTRHPEMIGELCAGPSRVVIMPDTYHVPHRERPDVVVDLVRKFVTALPT